VDNDCDGLTDCADTADCGADPACQGGSCDTITDKGTCNNDPTCEWVGSPQNGSCQDAAVCVPDETPEASCTDGVDNDCDGLTDCDDTADCGADPACQACVPDQTPETTCTDGIDNDCDGLTDCADTADCGTDPACQGGSCDTYPDKTSCQNNGCTWDNRGKVCM